MSETNWIYFGLFLDKKSKEKLEHLLEKILYEEFVDGLPMNIYCHHMTIAYNNHSEESQQIYNRYKGEFGLERKIIATHIGISRDAIAVRVSYDGDIINKIPHITLAVPIGGKPVNSNYIKEWRMLKSPIILTGILGEFVRH